MEKLRKHLDRLCDLLELLVALTVLLGLIYFGGWLLGSHLGFIAAPIDSAVFTRLLEEVFGFVVGIEFVKLLLKPNAGHVIEVLVFLIARHLILSHSTALEILASVVAVIGLYGFHFFLHSRVTGASSVPGEDQEESPGHEENPGN